MSGKRDMFNILNAWVNDQAFLTAVLHHTAAASSPSAWQIWLRIKHI